VFDDVVDIADVDEQRVYKMELTTLFFIIVTCLLCAALAFFGFRPTTFEPAVAAESGGDKVRAGDAKKKKPKKHQTSKKIGVKKSGLEESEDDDSMPDEDVAVGLLHARGISLKTTENINTSSNNNPSPRAAMKAPSKSKTDDSRALIGIY